MRDPYLYENSTILKNKLHIRTQKELDDAEADYVVYRLKDLALNPMPGKYDTEHFLKMHHFIFQDLYEWAREPRVIAIFKEEDVLGGMSVEYSDTFDITRDISLNFMKNLPNIIIRKYSKSQRILFSFIIKTIIAENTPICIFQSF